ncbi:1-acyl-sn-glycerol-3-phosphate acyltransferase [Rheinheimera aquimaris]|uniref:lysophospholipid acyltransferase family protein n=1 Tax=Rheinheimera aquimaris TaxID=412437 RepID=UPI001CFFA78B|nr:1-acyl-sn-glycerol-3-phosphate acyltransferase [Rheinheimera aquimaris]MCB5211980.1 1-acyl-sn-glycerol-3-phosphate acyltransferase [Rheinheimera aquimaris]
MSEQDLYADIRPYNDAEVAPAIARLIADDEFIQAILHYRFPHLSGPFGWLLSPLVKFALKRRWAKLNTVHAVQKQVAGFMDRMIDNTTNKVTVSGIEQLQQDKAYLFISNHRDIAMDPALVNWCLHHHGFDTVRIAIGDNLLRKACATELMKLNKSFIVKRGAKGPREMLKNLSQLSGYIKHSLEQKHSIWIAQKEGRAKDGNDETDPAILKMFYMEGKKRGEEFASYMAGLNIVPVCLSYEYDPCDADKVKELWHKQTQGAYQKAEFEDIDSIIKGIVGIKGRVHVGFGKPISEVLAEPEQLAALIDQQIWQQYRLFPINYLAAGQEHTSVNEQVAQQWQNRLQAVPVAAAPMLSALYAAPLVKQQQLDETL